MPAAPGTTSAPRSLRTVSDAEIADLVESAHSRRLMDRPRPRADLREGLSRTYDVLARLANDRGPRFLTSWDELGELCDIGNGARALATMQAYCGLLEEVRLISVGPIWAGRAWALLVQLPSAPARPCSSTGVETGVTGRLARFRRQMLRFRRGNNSVGVGRLS
jgi:hypothetical protein